MTQGPRGGPRPPRGGRLAGIHGQRPQRPQRHGTDRTFPSVLTSVEFLGCPQIPNFWIGTAEAEQTTGPPWLLETREHTALNTENGGMFVVLRKTISTGQSPLAGSWFLPLEREAWIIFLLDFQKNVRKSLFIVCVLAVTSDP